MKLNLNLSIDMAEAETMALMARRQATQQTTETDEITETESQTEQKTEKPQTETDEITETESQTEQKTEKPQTETDEITDEYAKYFNCCIEDLAALQAEQFMELVTYAKQHNNRFPAYSSQFKNIVNADDAYCSALIRLTRLWSEEVERKAFQIFGQDDIKTVVKMITVLQSARAAVRDSAGDLQTFYCLAEVVDAYMSTL